MCLGAAEMTILVGRVCEDMLGPGGGLLGSGSCPHISQPHPYWFLWVLTSQEGTSLGRGAVSPHV